MTTEQFLRSEGWYVQGHSLSIHELLKKFARMKCYEQRKKCAESTTDYINRLKVETTYLPEL